MIDTYQRNLKDINAELSGKPTENDDAQKYEILA
jgi:hypothetical protein